MTTTAVRPPGQRRAAPPATAAPTERKAPLPRRGDDGLRLASSAMTMVAIVCLWMAVQVLFLGGLSQVRDQELLYGQFRKDLAAATAPVGPVVEPGAPVALLSVPAIDLEQVVVEGTASGDLLAGPGHRRDTALPGQAGVSNVYGRASTYGRPFARLTELRAGDRVTTVTGQGRMTFTVVGVRRAGDPIPPLPPNGSRLTLVTGEGSGRLASLSPHDVVHVDADASKAFRAPPARPLAVPESEKPMQGDPSVLPLLALLLGGLVAVTLGVVAARQRWSLALVWVVAAPVAVALAWATTDAVMRLLPNLV